MVKNSICYYKKYLDWNKLFKICKIKRLKIQLWLIKVWDKNKIIFSIKESVIKIYWHRLNNNINNSNNSNIIYWKTHISLKTR